MRKKTNGVYSNTDLTILQEFVKRHPWKDRPSEEVILRGKALAKKLAPRKLMMVLAEVWGVKTNSIAKRLAILRKAARLADIRARFRAGDKATKVVETEEAA